MSFENPPVDNKDIVEEEKSEPSMESSEQPKTVEQYLGWLDEVEEPRLRAELDKFNEEYVTLSKQNFAIYARFPWSKSSPELDERMRVLDGERDRVLNQLTWNTHLGSLLKF